MDIISNCMINNYLNCLLNAATSMRVSSGHQRQAGANCDVSPNSNDHTNTFCENINVLNDYTLHSVKI